MENPAVTTIVRKGRLIYRLIETVPARAVLRINSYRSPCTKTTTVSPTTVVVEIDTAHLRNLCIRAIRNTRGRSQAGPISAKVWPNLESIQIESEPL